MGMFAHKIDNYSQAMEWGRDSLQKTSAVVSENDRSRSSKRPQSFLKTTALVLTLLLAILPAAAQNLNERDYIRMGNKYFKEGRFAKAETCYQKSIAKNPTLEAYYNLANTQMRLPDEDSLAYANYQQAAAMPCNNAFKRAKVFHNMGVMDYIYGLSNEDRATAFYQRAVDNFKSALRLNPNDDETRYNLAMAQYQLKKSQQQGGGGGGQNNQEKDDKDKQEEQKQQQQKQQQQQQPAEQQQAEQQEQKQDQADSKNNAQRDQNLDEQTIEQILNAAQQDEKNVRKKIQKQVRQRKLDKDW